MPDTTEYISEDGMFKLIVGIAGAATYALVGDEWVETGTFKRLDTPSESSS